MLVFIEKFISGTKTIGRKLINLSKKKKLILFSDETDFCFGGYDKKYNCRDLTAANAPITSAYSVVFFENEDGATIAPIAH